MVYALSQSSRRRPEDAVDAAPADVICALGAVTWADTRRRRVFPGDRLLEAMLREPRIRRLLVADPFRSLPVRLVRRALGERFEMFPQTPEQSLHQPMRLRREDPPGIKALERRYRAYDRSLQRAASRAGLERPRLITMNPLLAGFGRLAWAQSVTLYAEDDWGVADCFGRWRSGIEEAYRRIRVNRVRVCAVSAAIVEHIAPEGPCAVVPNGIDPDEWLSPQCAPAWFAALPRPRVLYLGTIDDRLDVRALMRTATHCANGTVALVGRLAEPARFRELLRLPNVHVYDGVPRSEVLGVTFGADVGVIPHVRSALTETMSPLKLYEYLAAGLPVCATDLPPIRDVDRGIVLVDAQGDFGTGVASALERGPAGEAQRTEFIRANSWKRRHDDVLQLALA